MTHTPNLIVIYTDHLDDCRTFYTGLGLHFATEQHGNGPQHYAAPLTGGTVLELYPASHRRPATGSLRLGLTAPAGPATPPPGRHLLTDPDGRTVDLNITQENAMDQQTAQTAVRAVFGDTLQRTDIKELPGGALAITLATTGHTATIDGHPDTGFGWTVDPGEDTGFTGHDQTAPTLNDALRQVRDAFTR